MAPDLIAVVAYPKFQPDDADWIRSIRERHDPRAALIQPHFTLVFPIPAAATTLIAAAENAARSCHSFRVQLTSACAHQDEWSPASYLFLIPSLGAEAVEQLHRVLYAGELQPYLRREIPYQSHLTVGAKSQHAECADLAADLNRQKFSVDAVVAQIEVVAVSAERISSLSGFRLGDAATERA